jgi:DNA-binding LytR/AlgR family response regulator
MPAITGLDVVATIGAERMPATVFVTAYEQYAVKAFEANAVDYLVKPSAANARRHPAACPAAAVERGRYQRTDFGADPAGIGGAAPP